MLRRNKAGRVHDRDALSRTTGLGCAQQCGAVLRHESHDRGDLARGIDQARRARQAWARAQQGTARATEELCRDRDFSVATDLSSSKK